MSRCVCCNALIEYEYTLNTDLCGRCADAVRKAVKDDGIIRPDYVLHSAKSGVTPMRRSDYEG